MNAYTEGLSVISPEELYSIDGGAIFALNLITNAVQVAVGVGSIFGGVVVEVVTKPPVFTNIGGILAISVGSLVNIGIVW
ncbi:MAG: hypothetical protein LBH28_00695 [Oscillospiraceae bacterium]|jgi:hypothetical protein|nr:hypothetical protein [Oscillospiraceae bacterium]